MRRIKTKNTNILWIASFMGCAVFAVAMFAGVIMLLSRNAAANVALENIYEKSFFEMADSVNNIEINLSKMMISLSEEQTIEMAGEISKQAQMAQNSINQLPVNIETAHDTNKFLNQVGDWCTSYSRAILSGGDGGVYEDKIEDLYSAAKSMNASIREIASKFKDQDYRITKDLKREGIRNSGGFTMAYDTLNNSVIEYPEIIYDGPFSDREGAKSFKALDNLDGISEEKAIETVTRLFEDMNLRNISKVGETTEPAAYEFLGDIDGGTMFVSISKLGGKLLDVNTNQSSASSQIGKEKAKELAVEYASRCEYCDDLVPVWYNSVDNIALVNLAPEIDGVIHYPDLVKVKVGLDDGKLIGIEATGFCTNYCKRELVPAITESAAKSAVSPKLKIGEVRLVIIPINMTERLCFEVSGQYKNLDYFVYIDAFNGKQVNVLRVVDESQGEMVF